MRLHIPIGIILIIALILTVFGNIAIQEQRNKMLDQIKAYGQETVDFIAQISISPIQKFSIYQLDNYISQIEHGRLVAFCLIYDANDNLMAGNLEKSTQQEEDADIVEFAAPIVSNNTLLGRVQLGINLTPVNKQINSTSYYIGIALAMELLLIGLALSYFIHSRLVAPILRLSHTTQEIAAGKFSITDQEKRKDEIGALAQSINEMSHNLRESYQNMEQKVTERTSELTEAKNNAEQMAQNLKTLSEQQQTLLDNSPVGIAFVSMDRIILRVNMEFCQITGYAPNELIGKNSKVLYESQDYYEEAGSKFFTLLKHEGVQETTTEMQRKDGTTIICSLRGRLSRIEENVFGIIWSVEDITAKLRMEEELLKVRKLESIGVLAGGIAHDFNNILVAIIGNISLAEQLPDTSPKVLELLNSAKNASMRAKDLTGKLLTFAKGGEPVRTTEHLPGLIRESASFILSGSNIHCSYDFEEDLWAVHMDKGQINQVIQNLILNSSQAMKGGGSVRIRCRNKALTNDEIHGLESGSYVQLILEDTGPGIDPGHINKIFDPYFSTKVKDSNKGSGLGLAIVHSIVKKHNGSISVRSTTGQGTTFEIFLPATSERHPQIAQETNILPTGKGLVLVMDDDETIHNIMEEMLSYLGYTTLHSYDGDEAIEIYKKDWEERQEIEAVILDLTIPGGMGGATAVIHLQEINPSVKAIVSSGYSDDPILQNYQKAGFTNFITKPYQLLDLSKVMADTLAA